MHVRFLGYILHLLDCDMMTKTSLRWLVFRISRYVCCIVDYSPSESSIAKYANGKPFNKSSNFLHRCIQQEEPARLQVCCIDGRFHGGEIANDPKP